MKRADNARFGKPHDFDECCDPILLTFFPSKKYMNLLSANCNVCPRICWPTILTILNFLTKIVSTLCISWHREWTWIFQLWKLNNRDYLLLKNWKSDKILSKITTLNQLLLSYQIKAFDADNNQVASYSRSTQAMENVTLLLPDVQRRTTFMVKFYCFFMQWVAWIALKFLIHLFIFAPAIPLDRIAE